MGVSYVSHFDYITAPEGLEYVSLLGNSMRLSSAVTAGATSLPITPVTTVALSQFDLVTLYDGLLTEQVQVGAAGASIGASSIPLLAPGCVNAHAQYMPCSSKGIMGDLGTEILKASAWVENITKQSLWSTTQTETLRIPTMRASFDNQNILTFRTKQYPIVSINTLNLGTTQTNFVSYDVTQCFIDSNELVTVPVLIGATGTSTWPLIPSQMNRGSNGYLQVSYTAGYTSANMPMDIRDSAVLLVSALIARRLNPAGADSYDLGDRKIQATQRGDSSPDSLLIKDAKAKLSNYTLRIF